MFCFLAANHYALRDELVMVGRENQLLREKIGGLEAELAGYSEHCRSITHDKKVLETDYVAQRTRNKELLEDNKRLRRRVAWAEGFPNPHPVNRGRADHERSYRSA